MVCAPDLSACRVRVRDENDVGFGGVDIVHCSLLSRRACFGQLFVGAAERCVDEIAHILGLVVQLYSAARVDGDVTQRTEIGDSYGIANRRSTLPSFALTDHPMCSSTLGSAPHNP